MKSIWSKYRKFFFEIRSFVSMSNVTIVLECSQELMSGCKDHFDAICNYISFFPSIFLSNLKVFNPNDIVESRHIFSFSFSIVSCIGSELNSSSNDLYIYQWVQLPKFVNDNDFFFCAFLRCHSKENSLLIGIYIHEIESQELFHQNNGENVVWDETNSYS